MQLADVQLALKTLAGKMSLTEADFRTQAVAVEKLFNAEISRVEGLVHQCVTEFKRKQQLLT